MLQVPTKYKHLYTTDKPIILVTGGRGSAKSFNTSLFIKRLSYEENHIMLYSRYTMDSAEKSVIPEFQEKIDLEGDNDHFKVNSKEILNTRSDSKILFSGIKTSSGNQTAKLKGIQGLDTFIVDEAEEWQSDEEFDKIRLSIRKVDIQNRVIVIMNPSNSEHFIYKKYIKNTNKVIEIDGVQIPISTHPEVCHIHTTYLDNIEHLSADFLREVEYMKEHNREKYNHIILGAWQTRKSGAIYTRWKKGQFNHSLPYAFGLDFGFTHPTALVKVAVDHDKRIIYAKQMIYGAGITPTQLYKQIANQVKEDELIVADGSSSGLDKINELRQIGYNCIPAAKGQGSVLHGITKIQDYLIVIEDSPDIEHELNNYIWLDGRSETPKKEFDDALDALKYAFIKLTE